MNIDQLNCLIQWTNDHELNVRIKLSFNINVNYDVCNVRIKLT